MPKKGFKHSEETKRKMRESRQRENRPMYGKHHSDKTKKKMSKIAKERGFGKWTKGRTGKRSAGWKGGKFKDSNGYIRIYKPKHPFCKKSPYIFEHRLIMEKMIGRYLKPSEFVHHRNGIRDFNRPINLELCMQNPHRGKIKCPFCRKSFFLR